VGRRLDGLSEDLPAHVVTVRVLDHSVLDHEDMPSEALIVSNVLCSVPAQCRKGWEDGRHGTP
jgi:hypothetical protein